MTSTNIMYRVAHKESITEGMYRSCDYDVILLTDERTDLEVRHPVPSDDHQLCDYWNQLSSDVQQDHLFGFKSIEQLKFWVYKSDWKQELHCHNFIIYVIESEEIHHGDTQSVMLTTQPYEVIETISFMEII